MGNILSYFFPQPAPAGIEQVVEEVTEDVATRKEATEVPVVPTTEVVGMIVDAKTEDSVERDFEFVEEVAEKTNEGFEFVKEDKLENVSNVLNEGKHDLQEEIISNKVASLEATEVEIIGSVKDSEEEAQIAVTPETVIDEAPEAVDNSVSQDNENIKEVEMIGSIQESNVQLMEEPTSESVDLPTSEHVEPIKVCTPEPLVAPEPFKTPTTEPLFAPEPVRALTPEAIIIITPKPTKETTPDPSIQDSSYTPIPELIEVSPPEPLKAATPEPSSASEPFKALSPEAIIVSTPEPTKATTPEPTVLESTTVLNPDLIEASAPEPQKAPTPEPSSAPEPVKVVTPEAIIVSTPERAQASNSEANIEEKNVKNAEEELSGGASGLKDLLTGSNDLNEE
eukprot:GFUD01098912.1.p1 GENE.GFUD01098912.1~~GFUD01098912.1.p1  ORF type:complete len:396 (+),score=142.40 GFUD01098912.1:51-1238(+)